jgi:protein-S-isoprenylcysteine O-methyltransferase Ste14
MVLLPVVFLVPAGTWRWWEAWVLCGIYALYAVSAVGMLARHDPALLAERLRASPVQQGQPGWDSALMIALIVVGVAVLAVPGLDVVRFGWSERLPVAVEVLALVAHVPAFLWIGWVMWTNTFLARVVKVDEARGHTVITTGPYAWVRHPMYVGVLVAVLAMPLALGSRWGVVPAVAMGALLVARTALEDRMLHRSLEGYAAYAEQTRYRLVPGLW